MNVCGSEAASLRCYLLVGVDRFSFRAPPMYNECVSPEQSLLSLYTHSAQTAHPARCSSSLSDFGCFYICALLPFCLFFLCIGEAVEAAAASNAALASGERDGRLKGGNKRKRTQHSLVWGRIHLEYVILYQAKLL